MFSNKNFKFLIKILPNPIKKLIKYFLNDIYNLIDLLNKPFDKIKKVKKTWMTHTDIEEYRKKIKIYDTFLFFNEIDLLKIRLNTLDPFVDFFVIVEATVTFTGKPKKLYFEENRHLFEPWKDKIIHYIIEDTPLNEDDLKHRLLDSNLSLLERKIINDTLLSDNIPHNSETQWLREFYQKESIKKALYALSDDDFCYLSDLDEIWNPQVVIDYSKNNVYKLRQNSYIYYLNNRSNENWRGWTGTTATKYINIKNGCLNYIRTNGKTEYVTLLKGGWHFTFQGGIDSIKQKIESYGHQEINTIKIKADISNTIYSNKDIRGRRIKYWIDNNNLPKYLENNRDKYENLFKN